MTFGFGFCSVLYGVGFGPGSIFFTFGFSSVQFLVQFILVGFRVLTISNSNQQQISYTVGAGMA